MALWGVPFIVFGAAEKEFAATLAKFIGWLAKVIRAVFNAFADMLNLVARSFGG